MLSRASKYICIFLIISAGICMAEDLPDTVFPWGVYSLYLNRQHHEWMRDSLGFNLINLAWDDWKNRQITDLMSDGFVLYPNRTPDVGNAVNYSNYAEAYYVKIEAEDYTSQIRFIYHHPRGKKSGGFWSYEYPEADTILKRFHHHQRKFNEMLDRNTPTEYYPAVRLKIDKFDNAYPDTIIAEVVRKRWIGNDLYLQDSFSISSSLFYLNNSAYIDTALTIACGMYQLQENQTTEFQIYSTGLAKLYIDYLKVPDEWGVRLIDNHEYDSLFIESAYYPFDGRRVAGWYMADEPSYEQFRSFGYIDSLIRANPTGTDIPRVVTAFNRYDSSFYGRQIYDFIELAKPEAIWADIYTFEGGHVCGRDTRVSGWDYVEYYGTGLDTAGYVVHAGLQTELNYLDSFQKYVHRACAANDIDWWFMPQAYSGKSRDEDCDNWMWRLLTRSELRCSIFMSLCNNVHGIVLWRYHSGKNPYHELFGLVSEAPVYEKTANWYEVRDLAPYVKFFGSKIINDLTYNDSYICSTSAQVMPGYVKSVSGYSNSPNPDLGWFQVGEYHDRGGDNYFMLVNRACSRDSAGNEAPRVLAFVRIDADIINSDIAYIIDLAQDMSKVDGEWRAVPDTTLTAVLADGTIPFATFLRAGEGRLYKVVPADF